MENSKWNKIIIHWVNCLGIPNISIKHIKQLLDFRVFFHLIKYLDNTDDVWTDDVNHSKNLIIGFLNREYPHFDQEETFEHFQEDDATAIALLLLYYSCVKTKDGSVRGAMCQKLNLIDQKAIMHFTNDMMKHENITCDRLKEAMIIPISDLITCEENTISSACPNAMSSPCSNTSSPFSGAMSPCPFLMSPAGKCTPRFVHSPLATPPAQKNRRNRKVLKLEAALESERFDRNYLQEEIKRQNLKIEEMGRVETSHLNEIIQLRGQLSDLANSAGTIEGESAAERMNWENERRLHADVKALEKDLLRYMEDIAKSNEEKDAALKKLADAESSLSIWRSQALQSDSAQDVLKNQVEEYKTQVTSLKSALAESNKILEEYKRDNQLNVSIECEDDTLTLKKNMSTSFSGPLENLGKAVIDIQLQEQINLNHGMLREIEILKKEKQNVGADLTAALLQIETFEKSTTELSINNEKLSKKVESLTHLEEQLSKSQFELAKICDQLTLSQQQNKHLENTIGEQKSTIQELVGVLSTQANDIQTLTDCKCQLVDEIQTHLAELANTHSRVQMLEQEINDLKLEHFESDSVKNKEIYDATDKVNKLQETVDDYLSKLKTIKDELSEADDSVKCLKKDKERLEACLEIHEIHLNKLADGKIVLDQDIEQYKLDAAKFAEQLTAKNEEIEKLLQSVEVMEDLNDSLGDKLKYLENKNQEQFDSLNQKEKTFMLNLQESQQKIDTMQKQLDDFSKIQQESVICIENLTQDCCEKNNLVSTLESKHTDMQRLIDLSQNELENVKADLLGANNIIEELKKQKDACEADLEKCKTVLEKLEVMQNVNSEKLEKIETQRQQEINRFAQKEELNRLDCQNNRQEIVSLHNQLNELNDAKRKNETIIEHLKMEFLHKNEEVDILEKKILELQECELKNAKSELNAANDQIMNLMDEKDRLNEDLNKCKIDLEILEDTQNSNTSLRDKLEKVEIERQQQIDEITQNFLDKEEALKSNTYTYQQKVEIVLNRFHLLNDSKEKNEVLIENMKSECLQKDGRIAGLENKIIDLEKIVDSNLSEIKIMESNLIAANNQIESLVEVKEAIETDLCKCKVDLEELEVVKDLNSSLSANLEELKIEGQRQIRNLLHREEVLRKSFQLLEKEVGTIGNQLKDFEEEKQKVETFIENLKSECSEKNQQVDILQTKVCELQEIDVSNLSKLKAIALELDVANDKIKVLVKDKDVLESDLNECKIQLNEKEVCCQNKNGEIDSLLCKNISIVQELSNFEEIINQSKKDIDSRNVVINELSKEKEDLYVSNETLKNKLKQSEDILNERNCLVDKLTETVNDNIKIVASNECQIKELSEHIEKLEQTGATSVLAETVHAVEIEQLVNERGELEKLNEKLSIKLKAVDEMSGLKEKELSDMKSQHDEHLKTIESYEKQLVTHGDEISTKNNDIETHVQENCTLKSELELLKLTLEQFEESAKKKSSEVNVLIQEKNELEIMIDSIKLESLEDKQSNGDNISCDDLNSYEEDLGEVNHLKFLDASYPSVCKMQSPLGLGENESSIDECNNNIKSKLLELCRSTEMISKTCARNILEKDETIWNLTSQRDNLTEKNAQLECCNILLQHKLDDIEKTKNIEIFNEKFQTDLENFNDKEAISVMKMNEINQKKTEVTILMDSESKNFNNSDTISSTTKVDTSSNTFDDNTVKFLQKLITETSEAEIKLKNALDTHKENDTRLTKWRTMLSLLNDKIVNCMEDKNKLEEALLKKQHLETDIARIERSNVERTSIIIEYTVNLFKWAGDNIQTVVAKDNRDVSRDNSFNNSELPSFGIDDICDEKLSETLDSNILEVEKFTEQLDDTDCDEKCSVVDLKNVGVSVYTRLYESVEKNNAMKEKLIVNEKRLTLLDCYVKDLKDENNNLRNVNGETVNKLAGLRIVLKEMESKNKELVLANEELKASNDVEMNLHAKEREHYRRIMADNVDLKKQLEALTAKINDLNKRMHLETDMATCRYEKLLAEHQKLLGKKSTAGEDTNQLVAEMRNEYEDKLTRMKQKMKQLYQDQIAVYSEKQKEETAGLEALCNKYTAKIKSYEAHVNQLSSEIWKIGEKLLMERNEKEWLRKQLKERFSSQQSLNSVASVTSLPASRMSSQSRQSLQSSMRERQGSDTRRQLSSQSSTLAQSQTFKVPMTSKVESGGLHMSDEEGEVFDNTYLLDLKAGICEPRANSTANINISGLAGLQPDRLSELQWRNSLCLPHMKSSYPAETQFHDKVKEEEIKMGIIDLEENILSEKSRPRKEVGQTSYKRPGPPTPSKNGGRSSLQGNEGRDPLREQNENVPPKKATTPSRIKSLFMGNSSRSNSRDENTFGTPKGRRLSIFRKQR